MSSISPDEVVTGFGRLGEIFASEMVHIVPDSINLGQGIDLRLCGAGASSCPTSSMISLTGPAGAGKYFTNGFTYSGPSGRLRAV